MKINLRKMAVEFKNPVEYFLSGAHAEEKIPLNSLLGYKIRLRYLEAIYCIQCGKKTAKSFQQGYCFPCFKRLTECNLCIIHPEKCLFYTGVCKADDWAHAHCVQPHVVYLANSSGLKVGITRASHVTTRWIDQGASQGLVILQVQNRQQSGLAEVIFKSLIADKTHWQKMLKGTHEPIDLYAKRDELLLQLTTALSELDQRFKHEIVVLPDAKADTIQYPILTYPQKVKALNFHKTPLVEGILQGIKGQYLLLDTGVISIRKFAGYSVEFTSTV